MLQLLMDEPVLGFLLVIPFGLFMLAVKVGVVMATDTHDPEEHGDEGER